MKPLSSIPPKSRINFTSEEKIMLKNLISNHKIVCSKKIDCVSRNAKKKAWETIAAEFSSTKGCSKRTPAQLMKLWDNMKFIHRRNSRTLNKERPVNDAQAFLAQNVNGDSFLDPTSNDTAPRTKSFNDSDTLYLLDRLSTGAAHFIDEPCVAGNSSGVVTQYHNHMSSETRDPLGAGFKTTAKHDFIENLMRVEEVENERISHENQPEDHDGSKEKQSRKNTEITFNDLLKFKKEEMEKMYELKKALHIAKCDALKAKEKAFKMKAAYYEFKTKKFRHCSVLMQQFLSL